MAIRHTTVATFADEPGAEINKAEWNADHTNPDIADVTGLQAELDALQAEIDLASKNIFRPEDFGAVADGVYSYTGEYLGGGRFHDDNYTFTTADIGKIWGQDGALSRTVTGVISGDAIISPDPYGSTDILWQMGTDDKTALRDACTAAAAVGGVVGLTPGKIYATQLTSAGYNLTTNRAAVFIEPHVTITTLNGVNEQRAAIMALPKSYGWLVANHVRGDVTDFATVANLDLLCFIGSSPNMQGGFELEVAYSGFLKTDAYNRVYNVTVKDCAGWGARFKGRGGLKLRDVDCYDCTYGMQLDGQYDFSIIGGEVGGNKKTSLNFANASNGLFTGMKVFYGGASGGSDADDSCGLLFDGTDYRQGFIFGANNQIQQTRGHSTRILSGNIWLDNLQCQDPSDPAINSGTLPSNMSAIYVGTLAHDVVINASVKSSFQYYQNPNWSVDVDAVYIEDVDGSGNGPQNISGNITTQQPVVVGGVTKPGIQYSGTGQVKAGGGITNGKNANLYIDGVPCAATITPASGDLIEVIDISDTTASASGTKKLVAASNFGGATSLATVEKDLGSSPRRSGKFTITGLTGLTTNKPVSIMQAVGPYTGKGTLMDEAEMDGLTVSGVVTSATEITAYWNAATRVKGNFKFNYFVGA